MTVCLFYLCTANAKTTTSEISLRFDTDIDQLDDANQKKLKEFLSAYSVDDDLTIIVRGHADKRGSNAYNLDLSDRRATTVTSLLTGEGFCDIGIVTEAFGEQKPIDGTGQNLADNRRVDVIIKHHEIESEAELLEILGSNNDLQKEINLTEENVIKSERGTIIGLPANCFMNDKGEHVADAILSITEALSYQDFLAEGLATISNGQMLESGGMLKIEALSSTGEKLSLDPNKPITISLPTAFKEPGMTLFVSDSGSDWQNTSTPTIEAPSTFPPRPQFLNFTYPLPVYKASAPPVRPMIRKRPKLPREIDDSKYELKFEWYEIVGRKKKIERMTAAKKKAYQRYDRSMGRYAMKLEKFILDSLAQPEKHIAYQEAVTAWKSKNKADSLEYIENVYKPRMAKREAILSEYYADYDARMVAWRDSCQKIRDAQLAVALSTGEWNIDLLRSYTFQSTNLGWINCDRFYSEPEIAKIQLKIQAPKENQVFLVFENINSMLPCTEETIGYQSPKIPKKQDGMAIAYSVKKGQIMLDQTELTGQSHLVLNPKPVSLNEFREALHFRS